jgi:hypothetical protein
MNEIITFDGYDGVDLVVKRINIWRDYNDRTKGVLCSVRHGHQGVLLGTRGDACKVRTTWMGVEHEGWVTFWFIKELKAQWQLSRLEKQLAVKKTARSAA